MCSRACNIHWSLCARIVGNVCRDGEDAAAQHSLSRSLSPPHRRLSVQGSSQWDRLQAAIQLVASPAGASPRASGAGGAAWQPLLRGSSADGVPENGVRCQHLMSYCLYRVIRIHLACCVMLDGCISWGNPCQVLVQAPKTSDSALCSLLLMFALTFVHLHLGRRGQNQGRAPRTRARWRRCCWASAGPHGWRASWRSPRLSSGRASRRGTRCTARTCCWRRRPPCGRRCGCSPRWAEHRQSAAA
jgi:hypothetical protein